MVIVAGHIAVDPEQRESYLAGSISVVEKARRADGCLDFAITADLLDPGRVNLFERWESQAAVKTFRRSAAQQARHGNPLGVGSRVRHRRRAAPVRERHRMNLQHGPCHDR
jgi:quinol monooxygenase YgiN